MQHDLSANLQAKIAEVLVREASIAQQFVGLPGLALLMIEASVMMVRTTAGTIANTIDDADKADEMIAQTIDAIVDQIRKSQADIVTRVTAEIERRRAS
jgi:hypothetical protein